MICYPPVLVISLSIASLSAVTPWCSLPSQVPWEVLMLHCSSAFTGVLSDEVISTCINPACGTAVHLQPAPWLCLVPSCRAVPSQHTETEVVEVAAQSHIPCSFGNDSSRFRVGHQQETGAALLCPVLPQFSRSPARDQCCLTGLREAEMGPSGTQRSLLGSASAFLADSGLTPKLCFLFLVPYDCKLFFHSLPALPPR